MSKQPQLPLTDTLKTKLNTEQKQRLNQLIAQMAMLGQTQNLTYGHYAKALEQHQINQPIDSTDEIDYIQRFALTAKDLPILRVMLESDKLYFAKDDRAYINLHIAIAISQLQDESGIPLLLNQIYKRETYDDDWIGELYPFVLAKFGQALFGYAKQAYSMSKEPYVRAVISEAVKLVAKFESSLRPQTMTMLIEWLSDYQRNSDDENAILIHNLCELTAVEALPLIKQAFDSNKVNLSHMGDYEEVEILMGLKTERTTPRPNFWNEGDEERFAMFEMMQQLIQERASKDEGLVGGAGSHRSPKSKINHYLEALQAAQNPLAETQLSQALSKSLVSSELSKQTSTK